eukprot:maker-scaffold75_size407189-snap-gene-0.12 protein:Tk10120 transcript:maker-scaffold75_size407189-snap-gene-0.12-mRNA-1 annotation:"tropomodulin-like isoform x2"
MTTFESTYESVETFESTTTKKSTSVIRSRKSSRRSSVVPNETTKGNKPQKTGRRPQPKLDLSQIEAPAWSMKSPFNPKIAPVQVSFEEIDELIATLNTEELEELAKVDPDDSSMPPSMRCLYNCEKASTGHIDRSAMLKDLHDKAAQTPDVEENVEFVPGTIRGKKFVPKEDPIAVKGASETGNNSSVQVDDSLEDIQWENEGEYSECIANATDEELKEIADILGLTYQNDCLATTLRQYPDPPPNDSNIDDIIRRVQSNDPDLIDINLNNIKGIGIQQWKRLFDGLAKNDHVELLTAANCDIFDSVGGIICDCLKENSNLKLLTLDSNSISGEMIVNLIRATSHKKTLEELRVSNQLNCKYLGNRIETEISNLLPTTPQLVKLGLTMEFRDTLNRTAIQLQKNLDK